MKAAEGVYAIGDLARFPYWINDGETIRVEHYGMAMYQGSVAAHNIMGKRTEVHSVPFFWTTQYGKSIRYAGHALRWDDFLIDGDVEAMNFAGYYVEKNKIVAVVAVSRDPLASIAAELFDANKMPNADQLKASNFNLASFSS
jgi:NADPH-dependent 2,4-dienoyl-CoA reductase/sulfur reductase-like enzyme